MNGLVGEDALLLLSSSYIALGGLMFANTLIGFPPSEAICLAFGAIAAQADMQLLHVIAVATVCNVAGTSVWFLGARRAGSIRVERFLYWVQQNRWLGFLARPCGWGRFAMRRSYDFFDEHGALVALLGRNVPLVRSMISVPLGLSTISYGRFLIFTSIGIAIWVTLWCGIGYYIGREPGSIGRYIYGLGVLLGFAGLVWAILRRTRLRKE